MPLHHDVRRKSTLLNWLPEIYVMQDGFCQSSFLYFSHVFQALMKYLYLMSRRNTVEVGDLTLQWWRMNETLILNQVNCIHSIQRNNIWTVTTAYLKRPYECSSANYKMLCETVGLGLVGGKVMWSMYPQVCVPHSSLTCSLVLVILVQILRSSGDGWEG